MSDTTSRALRARHNAGERRIAEAVARRDGALIPEPTAALAPPDTRRVRPKVLVCGWCTQLITVKPAGRIPRWCSTACRHRAWEQNRAAASGRSGIQIIQRIVEVQARAPTVRGAKEAPLPRGSGWHDVLHELARQLDTGRIYDRDLPDVTNALTEVTQALRRRRTFRGRR